MKIAVIYNPVGDRDSVEIVERSLENRGIEADWIETAEDDPGRGQAQKAAADGCDLVIAIGGDGTVRACAEGLAGTSATLAIIPAGTGNLLARNLEIPIESERALAVALDGDPVRLDVGSVNGETFAVIAGAGIDAVIMDGTDRASKDRLGVLAYVIEGAKHVFDAPIGARIRVDGDREVDGKWATVMVGNLGRLQGGVDLFPDSSPNDGLIDVLGLSASSPVGSVAAAAQAVANRGDRLLRAQATQVVVTFDEPTPYQLDGEARSATDRLEFSIEQESLSVMTPGSQP
jgi:YegS/Rv2252/BmrU family lipid kinase